MAYHVEMAVLETDTAVLDTDTIQGRTDTDYEFVSCSSSSMRGLSGGQKVKVVLAAATWRRPHIIILDEPTNFLDRESLAALIGALKTYEGGVAIITHSQEFSENVCQEIWAMDGGRLRASGHNWVEGQGSGERLKEKEDEEDKFDAMGECQRG